MPETKRLFVAIPVTDQVKQVLSQHQYQFSDEAIRFVPESNLHLTVHFLGEVPVEQVEVINHKLQVLSDSHSAFTLQLKVLEAGPKPKSPRLIWARFAPHPEFTQLSTAVSKELAIRPPDHADYIPHITLARFRKDRPRPVSIPKIEFQESHILPVSTLALWQSELKSPHPIYSIVSQYPLQNPVK